MTDLAFDLECDAAPLLAVVEVTADRPDRPEYHAKVQTLNSRVVTDAEAGGWRVRRLAAADLAPDELLTATGDADAIVIVGGEDITPRFYGARGGYEGETRHYEAADAGQLAIVRRALQRRTPVLGICRGLQIINVALGGTIVQHIVDDGVHRTVDVPIDQVLTAHGVTLVGGSVLAESLPAFESGAFGSGALGIGALEISVQSAHHQGIDRLGSGLVAAAFAPDGLVEALEHISAPVTGVQWHPEAPDAPPAQLSQLLAGLKRQLAVPVAA